VYSILGTPPRAILVILLTVFIKDKEKVFVFLLSVSFAY